MPKNSSEKNFISRMFSERRERKEAEIASYKKLQEDISSPTHKGHSFRYYGDMDERVIDLLKNGDPKVYGQYVNIEEHIRNRAELYEQSAAGERISPHVHRIEPLKGRIANFREQLQDFPQYAKVFDDQLAQSKAEREQFSAFEQKLRDFNQYIMGRRGDANIDAQIAKIMTEHSPEEYSKHLNVEDYMSRRTEYFFNYNDKTGMDNMQRLLENSPEGQALFKQCQHDYIDANLDFLEADGFVPVPFYDKALEPQNLPKAQAIPEHLQFFTGADAPCNDKHSIQDVERSPILGEDEERTR